MLNCLFEFPVVLPVSNLLLFDITFFFFLFFIRLLLSPALLPRPPIAASPAVTSAAADWLTAGEQLYV